jgi:cell division protein FtsL
MTPPPAAAATARRAAATHPARPRPRRAPAPRRVSGPAGGLRVVRAAAGAVHTVAEHRFLDRLIRGRMWIGILAVGLIGIVFMQVSMLRMNAGIGSAVERAATLERQNAALQASISQLSSGERIETAAEKLGFVLPAAGSVRFLDARDLNVRKAVRGIEPPGSRPPEPATTAPTAGLTIGETGVAPSENDTQTANATPTTTTTPTGATTPTTAATTAPAAQPTQQPTAAPAQQPQSQPTTTTPVAATGGAAAAQG